MDRAILDGETEGFVRVHVRKAPDNIVGATIVAAHAGDMISNVAMASATHWAGSWKNGEHDLPVSNPGRSGPKDGRRI